MAFINYLIHLAILIGIYSIVTFSLNLAVGFTGLLNLGHVGFFGVGAYVSALLAVSGVSLWISICLLFSCAGYGLRFAFVYRFLPARATGITATPRI